MEAGGELLRELELRRGGQSPGGDPAGEHGSTRGLRRREIAEMTGAALHTISRLLSAWEQKGLVKAGASRTRK